METTAINKVIRIKNAILVRQTKRIKLLEEKMAAMRKKYFQLKYADVLTLFRENIFTSVPSVVVNENYRNEKLHV
ncbi:MAG TPA: hypothetical protein VFU29_15565 [Chitinophagaceae bacterium]|nr:hypothetical protein [Chitinophagaceae bacterium]